MLTIPKIQTRLEEEKKTHAIVTLGFLEVQRSSLHLVLTQSAVLDNTCHPNSSQALSLKEVFSALFFLSHAHISSAALTPYISSLAEATEKTFSPAEAHMKEAWETATAASSSASSSGHQAAYLLALSCLKQLSNSSKGIGAGQLWYSRHGVGGSLWKFRRDFYWGWR